MAPSTIQNHKLQLPTSSNVIKKSTLCLQSDLNPGPSNYKAAVLLTELHCQTENCGTIGGLYTQYAILAFIYSKYLRKSVLQLSQSCLCPSLVPNFSPNKDLSVLGRTNQSQEGQISPKELKIQKWQVSNLMLHRSNQSEMRQSSLI